MGSGELLSLEGLGIEPEARAVKRGMLVKWGAFYNGIRVRFESIYVGQEKFRLTQVGAR